MSQLDGIGARRMFFGVSFRVFFSCVFEGLFISFWGVLGHFGLHLGVPLGAFLGLFGIGRNS